MDFPHAAFIEYCGKYLISRDDASGIAALAARLRDRWPEIAEAWAQCGRNNDDGGAAGATAADREKRLLKLSAGLAAAARACDRSDLAGRDIPLRSMRGSARPDVSMLTADVNVCAKLIRAMVEVLAAGEPERSLDALSGMIAVGKLSIYDDSYHIRMAAIDAYIESGAYDLAIRAARESINLSFCPTSQFLLFKSLRAKKDALRRLRASGAAPHPGESVSESEILLDDLGERFCSEPFDTLATGSFLEKPGEVPFFACQCPGTLPYPVSDYAAGVDIESLWNGPIIQEIRRSVLDGDFTYCSRKLCPALTERLLPKRNEITDPRLRDIIDNHRTILDAPPQKLTLGHDPSCNLACPSCRNEVQVIKNEERERLDKITDEIMLPLMEGVPVSLILSTDGDPIGSKHFRRLIHSLDAARHAQVRLMLITNGLLMTPREWDSLGHVQDLVAFIGVSIDAAEAETYEDLRRPGKWATITANMEFLAELRRQGRLPHLGLQFVVQKKNFEQMPAFVALGRKWGADTIRFIRLTNIGSFSGPDFEENDVCDSRHAFHPRLIGILRDPCFRDPRVSMFTMTPLWDEANRLPEGSAA